ncbi:MAG: hypothetical protein FWH21_08995, partial [Kiritimatiellaeota bacterium]|nr:hypothetical protein [Kiritimatiellota bacterium]
GGGGLPHRGGGASTGGGAVCRPAALPGGGGEGGGIPPPPKFPAIRRDIAFVADAPILHHDVLAAIQKAAPKELTCVNLFDIFVSEKLGKGRRSLAYALEFRSPDRTLTDTEVNAAFAKIVQALKDSLRVEVREG